MVQYPTSKAALAKPDFDVDNAAETGFVDFFQKMPKRTPGTVRLFDRRDYYSAHGEDALFVADVVYHTKTVLKYWRTRSSSRDKDLASCTLSKAVATSFLRDALTIRQLRIEIYAQPGQSTSTSSNVKGKKAAVSISTSNSKEKWILAQAASPGNLEDVEDLLFANTSIMDKPICLAINFRIRDGVKTVGIAYADAVERQMGISEFVENDIWSNTESLLIQLGVKEIIYPADDKSAEMEGAKLRKLIERCGIVHAEKPKSQFQDKSVEQDMNGLIKGDVELSSRPEFDLKLGLSACSGLVAYLDLLSSDGNRKSFTLSTHDLSQYMRLDASAVRALTLMPDASMTPGGIPSNYMTGRAGRDPATSLFGLLNKCKTGQGSRTLAMWLKQPLVNLHQIQNRQRMVEAFVEETQIRINLRDTYLNRMPDFQRLAKKFQSDRGNLDDVIRAYEAVKLLPDIIAELEPIGYAAGMDGEEMEVADEELVALMSETFLDKLRNDEANTKNLVELVTTTIDLTQLANHKIIIKPEFDSGLESISRKIKKVKTDLDDQYEEASRDLGFTVGDKKNPLHFENHSVHGHCLRLTRKEASAIKGKKTYIELANKQNGCYFTTRKLKDLNEEYAQLSQSYEKKQSTLAKEIVKIAVGYASTLEGLNSTTAELDIMCSLAHVAINAPISYVKPKVLEKGVGNLILKDSRHPCIETLPDVNFIPNDVELVRNTSEFQIITGANTGGKSVYLRQIGCIALMAQIGSFVPASEAQVPIFDCILARVGAGDSQLKGISTFMAEMLETATILKSATKDSLIIVDELGRGTSTYDGFGLAWSISEHIATNIRCFALFATHFHDLTTLSEHIPHVKNLHVLAHVEEKSDSITGRDIVMLYKVTPGVSDQSFGIHVAELAKFPEEVVRLAKRKADELEEQLEDIEGLPHAQKLKCTPEEMAEGTALVSEMLQAWADKANDELPDLNEAIRASLGGKDGKQDEALTTARSEKELDLLRETFESFRSRMEKSPFISGLLLETY